MEKGQIIEEILDGCKAAGRLRPLVHMIPSFVTAALCADGIAALGGRPLMALAPEEMEEITSSADGLVVNMGQPFREKGLACSLAMETAAARGIPVLFDPVGAGASTYRRETAAGLIEIPWSGVIKGNSSEIRTVLTGTLSHEGVDSLVEYENKGDCEVFFSKEDDNRRSLILASTGPVDRIFWKRESDAGGTTAEISLVHGAERKIVMVGTGCLAGALAGTLLAADRISRGEFPKKDKMAVLTAGAIALVSWAGEGINTTKYGTYRRGLLDRLSCLEETDFCRYLENRLEWKEG